MSCVRQATSGFAARSLRTASVAGGLSALLFACAAPERAAGEPPRPPAARTVLTGVTVVDTRTGRLQPNMNLLLNDGRIVRVSAELPKGGVGGVIIDARGKYVVPGYLDMHAHPLMEGDPTGALQLMLANGVTGFRQMSGSTELLARRKAGTLRLPADSPALLAMPGSILSPANAGSVEDAMEEIRAQKAAGADFIKVGLVAPKVFFPAQAEAKRLGLPIVGHLPTGIDVMAVSRGGMKSIEHLGPGVGILAACSADEAGIGQAIAQRPELKLPPIKGPLMEKIASAMVRKRIINPLAEAALPDVDIQQRAISTFDPEKCRALAARFSADGAWQTPTLIRSLTSELGDTPEFQTDPNLRYMSADTIRGWVEATQRFQTLPSSARTTFRDTYALQLRLTKLFDEAGVKMLAGSDASGAAWEVPGFALHQEFDELAKAGLSPLRVLQMTTLNGAEFLGLGATMGAVEPGKVADLVILDANPIQDVQNLHRIAGVVRAGRYYGAKDLETLKAKVAAARSVH